MLLKRERKYRLGSRIAMGLLFYGLSPVLAQAGALPVSSPQELAMGNAGAGMDTQDVVAQNNPASLRVVTGNQLSVTEGVWPGDLRMRSFFVPLRINKACSLGMLAVSGEGAQNGVPFAAQEQRIIVSFLPRILENTGVVSIGMGLSIRSGTFNFQHFGQDLLGDIGALYSLDEDNRTLLGIAVTGIGAAEDTLPAPFAVMPGASAGISRYVLDDDRLRVAAALHLQRGNLPSCNAGGEYRFLLGSDRWCAFRAGFASSVNDISEKAALSAGTGVGFKNIELNYGFRGALPGEEVHVIGLRLYFKAADPVTTAEEAAVSDEDSGGITALSMKQSYQNARRMVEEERDKAIFSRKVEAADVHAVDRNRELAETLASNNEYEEAWVMLKYAYSGYQSLASQAVALEMLEEVGTTQKEGAQVRDANIELYRKGLQAYVAKDFAGAFTKLNSYSESGDTTFKEKARRIALAASMQWGMEYSRKGDLKAAARVWQQGKRIDPADAELQRCLREFITPKCNEYFNAGMAAYSKGEVKKAAELWKECLSLDPGHERAQKALQRLQ